MKHTLLQYSADLHIPVVSALYDESLVKHVLCQKIPVLQNSL